MGSPWALSASDSADYERFRPRYPASLFASVAALAEYHTRAWDCGAGSGQATRGLAPLFEQVIAMDRSAPQLRASPALPSTHRVVGDAERTPLRSACVDLIAVGQALHWFATPAFYREVRRVGRPRSVIAAWTYGLCRIDRTIDEVMNDFHTKAIGSYWPPDRVHVDQGYRHIPFPFRELATQQLSMSIRWTLDHLLGYVGTWSAVRRARVETGRDPVDSLAHALERLWGPRHDAREVVWRLTVRAGRVH